MEGFLKKQQKGEMQMKKKTFSFPSAYSILFIILVIAAGLTYIIPAGSYSKLSYNTEKNVFVVKAPSGEKRDMPATQATLDSLDIRVALDKFTKGDISKPVAIPGSYEKVEQKPQGIKALITAPISGVYDTIGIMLFVLILGGCIGVLNYTGALNAGIASLSRVAKGREFLLIIVVTVLIAIGGTTFGMAEETIAFYPILIPVFLAAGYDAMVAIASIYVGSSIGTMFSTVNPFSTVIASNAAGLNFTEGLPFRLVGLILGTLICIAYIIRYASKVKKNPQLSVIYDQKEDLERRFPKLDLNKVPKFTVRRKLMLIIFALTFVVMVYGVSHLDWWFKEMTTLFLLSGILIGFISGMGEKVFVERFIAGASELVGVGLIVGVARSINLILDNGEVSDSILHSASSLVQSMNPAVFVLLMLLVFIVLGFFIPSSSGLAVLSIPIMAPLADMVGLPRDVIINAYQFGQGLIGFVTPTGLILASLAIPDVTYDRYLRFILPLVVIIFVFSAGLLIAQGLFFSA